VSEYILNANDGYDNNQSSVMHLFPTLIKQVFLKDHIKNNEQYFNRALEIAKLFDNKDVKTTWLCNTYLSLGKFDVQFDPVYENLVKDIADEVKKFSKLYNISLSKYKIDCINAWINVAKPGAYQELHSHARSHFSVAYYINVPNGAGDIVFYNDSEFNNMFGLPESSEFNQINHQVNSTAGNLLIFRSTVKHLVRHNTSNENRVSLSANFVVS